MCDTRDVRYEGAAPAPRGMIRRSHHLRVDSLRPEQTRAHAIVGAAPAPGQLARRAGPLRLPFSSAAKVNVGDRTILGFQPFQADRRECVGGAARQCGGVIAAEVQWAQTFKVQIECDLGADDSEQVTE